MNGKSEKDFIRLLKELIDLIRTLKEISILYVSLDFEIAMINAIQICLPNVKLHCCYFHLKKAIKEWIKKKVKMNY